MELHPIHFISVEIEVLFDRPPLLAKKPHCPNGFVWEGETYWVTELLSQWHDFSRRGDKARNMQPQNLRKAARRGSLGVGRFYFQVRVENGRIFEIYYDRAWKSVDDRKGAWTLFREMSEKST